MSDPQNITLSFLQPVIEVMVAEPIMTITMPEKGVKGDPGLSEIGGYPIAMADIADGDLVQFNGGEWKNTTQNNITDGGNF